jgi:transcriptional regulator with XRE-family HTH domain
MSSPFNKKIQKFCIFLLIFFMNRCIIEAITQEKRFIIMSTVREEIAKNLLYYRKKSGYTQKQLAEKLGVKNSAVSNWENGQNSIDIETLCKACEIFQITLNDMYGRFSDTDAYTAHERSVLAAYRNNPGMQSAVDKLLGIEDGGDIAEDMANTVKVTLAKSTTSK